MPMFDLSLVKKPKIKRKDSFNKNRNPCLNNNDANNGYSNI